MEYLINCIRYLWSFSYTIITTYQTTHALYGKLTFFFLSLYLRMAGCMHEKRNIILFFFCSSCRIWFFMFYEEYTYICMNVWMYVCIYASCPSLCVPLGYWFASVCLSFFFFPRNIRLAILFLFVFILNCLL